MKQTNILIVHRDIRDLHTIFYYLYDNPDYNILSGTGLDMVLRIIKEKYIDLVIIDFEAVSKQQESYFNALSNSSLEKDITTIFILQPDQDNFFVTAYNQFTIDFIKKPVLQEELIFRIQQIFTLKDAKIGLNNASINNIANETEIDKLVAVQIAKAGEELAFQYKQNIVAIENEKQDLENQLDQLTEAKRRVDDEKYKLKASVVAIEDEKQKLNAAIKNAEEEKNNMQALITNNEGEKSKLQATIRNVEEEKSKMQILIANNEEEKNKLQATIRNIEEEKNKLQISLKTYETSRIEIIDHPANHDLIEEELEKQRKSLEADTIRLEGLKEELEKQKKSLETDTIRLEGLKEELEKQKKSLEADTIRLTTQKELLQADTIQLNTQKELLEAEALKYASSAKTQESKEGTIIKAFKEKDLVPVFEYILPNELSQKIQASEDAQDIHYYSRTATLLIHFNLPEKIEKYLPQIENIIQKYQLEKITGAKNVITYLSGITDGADQNPEKYAIFAALEIKQVVNQLILKEPDLQVNIGINTGGLIAGSIAGKKFGYDVWGDMSQITKATSKDRPLFISILEDAYKYVSQEVICDFIGETVTKRNGRVKVYEVKSFKVNS